MLLFLVIPLLGVLAIVADVLRFRRLRQQHRRIAPLRMLWCGATDLIPVAVPLAGLVVSDNTTGYMAAVMWLVWIWMLTVLPRLVYYIFRLLHLRRTGIVLACGIAAALIWGATLGRTGVHVSRVEVCSPRLPAGFDGMRIVQLSDMHLGTIVSPERELTRIVDSVNALRPELVIFTGDLVNIRASELDGRAVRLLRRIEAPVVSVTGNHDVGSYIKDTVSLPREQSHADLLAAQRAMGWRVLDDETLYLHRGGDSISLSGVSFDPALRKQRHDSDLEATNLDRVYAGVPDSLYNLTAVHLPQFWEQITARGYGDLTLAGHVHAMQFKVRLFGRAWSPAAWLYERWSGRYDNGRHTLYINDGTENARKTTSDVSKANRVIVGNHEATIEGGLTNTLRWKFIDLGFTFTFSLGGDAVDYATWQHSNGDSYLYQGAVPSYYKAADTWTPENKDAKLPKFQYGNTGQMSSRWLMPTDYLRLKTFTLGFSVPTRYLQTVGLSKARIYFSASNLLTWKSDDLLVDPEMPVSGVCTLETPALRTLTFGVEIGF